MPNLADKLRIALAICLIAICVLSAYDTALHASVFVFAPSMLLDFLLGLVMLATWLLLLAGGMGLLKKRRGAYWLIYLAAILNFFPGFVLVPFAGEIIFYTLPLDAVMIAVYGINFIFLALVIASHIITRRA